ncbi:MULTISPECIES: DivIVA domain-containing protein [unclassified Veillonella]|uniref:DivIVA domain-containing protein n=1 Tax=unclassified Veillonella TaxID=2630086 RepID=UPI0013898709|nr:MULTISPECIES: DivIVA domain-containing protein [unclassified Veillonella]KAF1682268.1 cell division protein DivIVA [Veillonella sp. R32]
MITPMDIHNKEFEKGFRGYDTASVDAFMAELVHDYETLYRDNREMTDKIEQLEKRIAQYEQMEATMNNTLVLAQETGENVKNAARKEADLIIQEAEQQRKLILEDAERSLREGQEKYSIIRNEVAVFKARMESILNSQLQLLDGCVLGDSSVPVESVDIDEVIAAVAEDNSTIHENAGVDEAVLEANAAGEAANETSEPVSEDADKTDANK